MTLVELPEGVYVYLSGAAHLTVRGVAEEIARMLGAFDDALPE